MSRLLVPLLALLLVPVLPAGSASGEGAVQTAALHVGDRLLYRLELSEQLRDEDGKPLDGSLLDLTFPEETQRLVIFEGSATVQDALGYWIPMQVTRVERLQDEEVLSIEHCQAPAGWMPSRIDYLAGGPLEREEWGFHEWGLPLVGGASLETRTIPLVSFWPSTRSCDGHSELQARAYRPGERVSISLFPEPSNFPSFGGATESTPAQATTFAGRKALTFTFPLTNQRYQPEDDVRGTLRVTIAEGLPGVARYEIDETRVTKDRTRTSHGVMELVGYEPGHGSWPIHQAPIPPEYEHEHPWARMEPHDPRWFDDSIFDFPYPFQEALDALLQDPDVGLKAWLEAHPSAGISQVIYDRRMDKAYLPLGVEEPSQSDGGWYFSFTTGTTRYVATSIRTSGWTTPAGPLASPVKLVQNQDGGERPDRGDGPPTDAFMALDAESLERFAREYGYDPRATQSLVYSLSGSSTAWLTMSEVSVWGIPEEGHEEGRVLSLSPTYARVESISRVVNEVRGTGIYGPSQPVRSTIPAEPASASLMPTSLGQAALAATVATTVLGLFLLLVTKVLVPLYTRLRRDRILQHPVRARLVELVRTHPGIHLNELEATLGIGRGATRHHVDQLVSHGLLFRVEEAGRTHCYLAGALPPELARREALLRGGSYRRVYDYYLQHPSASLREAAHELGLSAPSVHRARAKLEKAGLLPRAQGTMPGAVG